MSRYWKNPFFASYRKGVQFASLFWFGFFTFSLAINYKCKLETENEVVFPPRFTNITTNK